MRRFATVNLILLVLVIILLNLVARESFFRVDLTAGGAYSLSRLSREIVAGAEDPLHVKVFYSDQVPPPYNGVRRYLLDLLREYEAIGRGRFSYEIVDTSTPEGRGSAGEYGLRQVEIQEVRSDEFQSRAVFLGAVVLYGNALERVDPITATDGLEYRLTTAMGRAISQVDALAGSPEPVIMRAFLTPGLRDLGIQGIGELPEQLRSIHSRLNRENYERIRFELHEPTGSEVEELAAEYGLRPLRWQDGAGREHPGLVEILLSRGDRHQAIPLEIYSGFLGDYSLDEPSAIEEALRLGLRALVTANPRVGYATGTGERRPDDYRAGAGPFADLLGERYELFPIQVAEERIPPDIETLIVNGPREAYSETALYRIDQFVMSGGSLLVFLDRFEEQVPTQQEMMLGEQPEWHRINSGLEPLLSHYGIRVSDELVLDEEGFVASSQGRRVTIHQAPVLRGSSLNREHVITRDLEDMIVLNTWEIRPGAGVIPLLETSPRSWTVEHPSDAGPWLEGVPPGVTPDRRIVAALREHQFESFFAVPPEPDRSTEADRRAEADSASDSAPGAAQPSATEPGATQLETDRHRSEAVREARILVVGSSELTTAQLIDPQQRTANSTFLMNALDYLMGAPAFAELRGKGLGVARLEVNNPALPGVIRWLNIILVPLLVVMTGLLVKLRRRARSRRIQQLFREEGTTP
ncbi:MAG: hypothetical protein EA427_03760 [Spirochaetaceae bacterium]|nr:MAG: hypothetical protein EA427_03760 [Spirochaetaceae bacterium]